MSSVYGAPLGHNPDCIERLTDERQTLARLPAADRARVRFVVRRMVEPIEVNGEPNQ